MHYISTRGNDRATFSRAFIKGLAGDGGLFVPETLPELSSRLPEWKKLTYTELACEFFSLFADDMPANELRNCIEQAYGAFGCKENPAPLVELNDRLYVLELFHGPTLAFKDFALQLLGQLYGRHIRKSGHPVNILGATSGDTGSAAIYGMFSQPDIHSFILYPDGRIAELQERQIACTGSPLVHPIAIEGSFDDAQSIVKQIFGDAEFSAAHSLTAVNSINIARILAQCVYYLHTALKLDVSENNPLEFVVPTGNFGNILAGWLLTKMGIRGLHFCIATNQNSVVSDFFRTGEYRTGEVTPSCAPSMDIQQASNFERWLWWYFDGDSKKLVETMENLRRSGSFRENGIPAKNDIIRAASCNDAGIKATINHVWRTTGYIPDPHTACAFAALSNEMRNVVTATAHPAKFPDTIVAATGQTPKHPSLEQLKERQLVKTTLPANVDAVKNEIRKIMSSE